MNLEQRLELATRGTVEIIQTSELEKLLEEKKSPRAYWGFECSGTQAYPARNDAHRPRSRLHLQDSRPHQGWVQLHCLPAAWHSMIHHQFRRQLSKNRTVSRY